MTTKADLRTEFRRRRKELSLAEIGERSKRICDRFLSNVDVRKFAVLHTFIRIKRLNEIDTSMIYFRLWRDLPRLRTAAPRTDMDSGTIESIEFGPSTEFTESSFGIREPKEGTVVPPADVDCVLVPLLAFDMFGERVGYGGGFYDRFLAECRDDCVKVGLSLFPPADLISDTNENDIKLDMVITPDAVFEFN